MASLIFYAIKQKLKKSYTSCAFPNCRSYSSYELFFFQATNANKRIDVDTGSFVYCQEHLNYMISRHEFVPYSFLSKSLSFYFKNNSLPKAFITRLED